MDYNREMKNICFISWPMTSSEATRPNIPKDSVERPIEVN